MGLKVPRPGIDTMLIAGVLAVGVYNIDKAEVVIREIDSYTARVNQDVKNTAPTIKRENASQKIVEKQVVKSEPKRVVESKQITDEERNSLTNLIESKIQ